MATLWSECIISESGVTTVCYGGHTALASSSDEKAVAEAIAHITCEQLQEQLEFMGFASVSDCMESLGEQFVRDLEFSPEIVSVFLAVAWKY